MPLERRAFIFGALSIAVVLCLTGILLFCRLGTKPLQNYDEAFYAQIARESLESRSFATPTYLGKPYLEKPPLALWFMEASFAAVEDSEEAARLPSAIFGTLTVCLVMLFAWEATKNAYQAAYAGIILAATGAYIEVARQGRVDTVLVFFIVLSAYAFWKGLERPRWLLLFGLSLGLAIMTKDAVASLAVCAALSMAFTSRNWNWLISRFFWAGIVVCLCVVLPWHLYETSRFGFSFWQTYIGHEVILRAEHSFFMLQPTAAGYLRHTLSFAAPWSELFITSLALMLVCRKRIPSQTKNLFWAFALTALSIFAGVCAAQTKAFSYLLPMYPFMALAVAVSAPAWHSLFSRRYRFATSAAACAVIIFGLRTAVWNGWQLNPYFSKELRFAREEKEVGNIVRSAPDTLWAFQDVDLGTIIFYSGGISPLLLTANTTPQPGDFIVLDTKAGALLKDDFPSFSARTVYAGRGITLLSVAY